ncbi:MAG: acetolactate synthase small subunit [Kiritimatiellales bacterium]|nr:acetolactate synthase small subunit [Kiritimatiellales bacterium]MCF7863904.1 acetolactate synthase small subunit [Kiritimatiellales bacterium]
MLNTDKAMHTLSVYVANKPGVLARIAQVFARRGFNIESLVVSPAMDGHFSRMTISCSGDPEGLDQIIKQLSKLIDVVQCIDHTFDETVMKEMGLIKIAVDAEGRSEALQIADHFGCKTVDLTATSMILQVVGDPAKIDALEEMIERFAVIEFVRTGKVVMRRGQDLT